MRNHGEVRQVRRGSSKPSKHDLQLGFLADEMKPARVLPRQNQIRAALERFLTVMAIERSPLQSELGGD